MIKKETEKNTSIAANGEVSNKAIKKKKMPEFANGKNNYICQGVGDVAEGQKYPLLL